MVFDERMREIEKSFAALKREAISEQSVAPKNVSAAHTHTTDMREWARRNRWEAKIEHKIKTLGSEVAEAANSSKSWKWRCRKDFGKDCCSAICVGQLEQY